MIDGVVITSLKRIGDERGLVLHMLRRDWDVFEDFGEIYFSTVNPGVVKGWKRHKRMIQNFAVPMGNAKFVLYDDREDSPTKGEMMTFILTARTPKLLVIPPGIHHGWMSLEDDTQLIGTTSHTYNREDPDEVRIPADSYGDVWTVKGR